jgi:RHS repeat-associated protein
VGDYSFGFNGKELDKEGMGGGASTYDYGFRIYNSALGRFLSADPLFKSYPWNSSYAYAENDVIRSIDIDGLEKLTVTGNTIVVTMKYAAFRCRPEGGNVVNEEELLKQSEQNWTAFNEECSAKYGLEIKYDKQGNIEYAKSGETLYQVQFDVSVEVFDDEFSEGYCDLVNSEEFAGVYLFGDTEFNGVNFQNSDETVPAITKSLKPWKETGDSDYEGKEGISFKDESDMNKNVEVHEAGHTLGLGHFAALYGFGSRFPQLALNDLVHGDKYCSDSVGYDACYDSEGMMKYDRVSGPQTPKYTQIVNIINSNPGKLEK